jgi:hypothetical protein
MNSSPKYEGTEVEVGGTKYVVPPITLGLYFRLEKEIRTVSNGMKPDTDQFAFLRAGSKIVTESIKRNYPDLDEDEFLESVQMDDVPRLVTAVMAASGFTGKEGDARPLAEAAATENNSPAPASSDGLSPTPDGPHGPSSTS